MHRYSISFPTELEDKVKIVAEKQYNSFTGAALWMISEWVKDHELTLQDWEKKKMAEKTEEDGVDLVIDAVKKGKKVMVRLRPGGELVPLQEFVESQQAEQKKEKRSDRQ